MATRHRARVTVDDNAVGELTSPARPDPSVFLYNTGTAADNAVSVTMPVQRDAYLYHGLHPVFAQNLPEGYLGDILKKTIAKLYGPGDLTLLTALGRFQVGRVAIVDPDKADDATQYKGESLNELLNSGNSGLFEELVEKYALRSGVSGVQPKVIVPALAAERTTLKTGGFIVKSWGDDFPELAANEYFCMSLAKAVGLPVPDFNLSADGQLFIMKRFDRTGSGQWLGFEDGCVLQGRSPEEKYSGSYEQLSKSLVAFLSLAHRKKGLHALFLSVLVSWAVRNGDAHLKNFGIVYDQPFGERRLAPTYDIVSTVPYLSQDVPALTLAGRKVWWPLSYLVAFGRASCSLSHSEIRNALKTTGKSLQQQAQLIHQYRQTHPSFSEVGTAMEAIFLTSARDIEHYLNKVDS
ncbi:type II toxin-antitoxin system HipA family toxin [Saccharospirillum sp.]|uniref:type II toxin-antitoxin system HipA family toxin n=1 Tax=Saccharospirillum sp. TaxID=2033801 RepID=UPI0034A03874